MKYYLCIQTVFGDRFYSFDLPLEPDVPVLRAVHPDDLKDSLFSEILLFNDLCQSIDFDPKLLKKST